MLRPQVRRKSGPALLNRSPVSPFLWQKREQVCARLRSAVRRVLRRLGYPPDQTENAAQLILEQAEALAEEEFAV